MKAKRVMELLQISRITLYRYVKNNIINVTKNKN
jgi:predicted site-specific integrase-resolvase